MRELSRQEKLQKTRRTRAHSLNYSSPRRSGVVRLPRILCRAGALLPFTSPFYSEKQARGSRNPSRHPAAVICKQGSAPKCSTGIMILVTLPVHPPLLLIPVSATPARVPARAHRFSEGACQSIELLMHNHAQITAKIC